MKWTANAPVFPSIIKIVSTMLISGAIILEIWDFTRNFIDIPFHDIWRNETFTWVIILARFALISHLIEAIIAGFAANFQGKNPLKSAVYTFFVGTVGLLEFLKQPKYPVVKQI
ncbi:MAG TPA: hypothetical protein IGS52_17015 [Oscillatoriaceae cyanobacterium M33_DOE_052]|uniref:Uncharacterized protein n=1 Tax=Planktothricoides sp. SpSt-374 TaxID=2282167 RepID=A0A7C3VML1_9CYAN|nr:hypothetical protein [Oscillatoriaceae cyanobacterium M33_DOE_052]